MGYPSSLRAKKVTITSFRFSAQLAFSRLEKFRGQDSIPGGSKLEKKPTLGPMKSMNKNYLHEAFGHPRDWLLPGLAKTSAHLPS